MPAGIHAVLERSFADVAIPCVGVWARVPHYVAAMPYPAASVALLEGLSAIAGTHVESPPAVETCAPIDIGQQRLQC